MRACAPNRESTSGMRSGPPSGARKCLPGQMMLLLALASAAIGCARTMMGGAHVLHSAVSRPAPPVPVPELDTVILDASRIEASSGPGDVRSILGDPPLTTELRAETGELASTTWWYPIRDLRVVPLPDTARSQTRVIPAAVLRVSLDPSGCVEGWGFFHPISEGPMEIAESAEQAEAWMERYRGSARRIDLATVLRHGASRDDVLEAMRWFDRGVHGSDLERIQVRSLREGSRERLVFYAERPSPLYIPPDYLVVTFWEIGGQATSWHFQSW